MKEFKRYSWEEYEKMLISYNYSPEQISAVKEIRENSQNEIMTPEQFRYLFLNKIIRRTRKLKKPRTLIVVEDKIYYLEHYNKRYEWCGEFINTEE